MKRLMDYVNAAALICLAAFVMAGCEKDKKPGIPDEKPAVPPEIVEKAVDVSAGGTANCYLIKPGSTVTFTTMYKDRDHGQRRFRETGLARHEGTCKVIELRPGGAEDLH